MTSTAADSSPAWPRPEADLARLLRCMSESEQGQLLQAAVEILGKRCSLDPDHRRRSADERRQEQVEHEDLESRLRAARPVHWPGRELVELDNVGDAGAWLDDHLGESVAETLFGCDVEDMAQDMAQDYLRTMRENGLPLPSDFDDVPSGAEWSSEEEADARREFVSLFRHWRERIVAMLELQALGGPAEPDKPTATERYVDLLQEARSYRHRRDDALLDHLVGMGDPLIALATIGLLVRDRVSNEDWNPAEAARLFYGQPFQHMTVGGLKCRFLADTDKLELAWGEVETAADLCLAAIKRGLPGAALLAETSELGAAFWSFAFPEEALRTVVRDAVLAGVGKSVRLLDWDALKSMRTIADDPTGSESDILFLEKRLSAVLPWLTYYLTREQIVALPALVDFAAQLLVQERVDTCDDETIYVIDDFGPVAKLLAADLEAGLRAVCRAYSYRNPMADLIPDTLLDLQPHSSDEVKAVLRRLAAESEGSCRRGAASVLSDLFDEE